MKSLNTKEKSFLSASANKSLSEFISNPYIHEKNCNKIIDSKIPDKTRAERTNIFIGKDFT